MKEESQLSLYTLGTSYQSDVAPKKVNKQNSLFKRTDVRNCAPSIDRTPSHASGPLR